MFCRAKICGCVLIAGGLTASAASLDVRQQSQVFSTDQPVVPSVIKASETKAKVGTMSRWRRVKVHKISPVLQSAGRVEVNGFVVNRPADIPAPSPAKVPATPEKK